MATNRSGSIRAWDEMQQQFLKKFFIIDFEIDQFLFLSLGFIDSN